MRDKEAVEELGRIVKDAFEVRDAEVQDIRKQKKRAIPMSTYMAGEHSYPLRPKRKKGTSSKGLNQEHQKRAQGNGGHKEWLSLGCSAC